VRWFEEIRQVFYLNRDAIAAVHASLFSMCANAAHEAVVVLEFLVQRYFLEYVDHFRVFLVAIAH
jgi:hypothetical protein